MDAFYQFSFKHEDNIVKADLTIHGHGNSVHLQIGITGNDSEQGPLARTLSVDFLLNPEFKAVLRELNAAETDGLAEYIFAHSDRTEIQRVTTRQKTAGEGGMIGMTKTTQSAIPNLPFAIILQALASDNVVPILKPVIEQLIHEVDHPVWKLACRQSDMFFSSTEHRPKALQGRPGTEFDCGILQIWVADTGQNHRIIFEDQEAQDRFIRLFPPGNGGPTISTSGNQYILQFDSDLNRGINLVKTFSVLREQGILSPGQITRLLTHLLLLSRKDDAEIQGVYKACTTESTAKTGPDGRDVPALALAAQGNPGK